MRPDLLAQPPADPLVSGLPEAEALESAWAACMPVAGFVGGDRDMTALVDCLRVRYAMALHGLRALE